MVGNIDPDVPGVPQNPQATLDGDNVDVTWSPPVTGGPGITGYKVRAHLASDDTAVGQAETCDSPCTSLEFPTPGLTAGTAYRFKIYAVNQQGDSAPAETDIVETPEIDRFIYVALGDSYSSGEGAGNSYPFSDVPGYLAAYAPETYAPGLHNDFGQLQGPGNACHRALNNYANVNRNELAPEQEVVLIDVTCSAAKIENIYEPNNEQDQLSKATTQLEAMGLTGDDVDLVTLGVGGNDGNFSRIGLACVLPTVVRKLVEAHPNPPIEVEVAVNAVNCERIDELFFHSDEAIQGIKGKLKVLHTVTDISFPEARILQVDYPNILPAETNSPAYCGGVRSQDVDYARGRISAINDQIRAATAESQTAHPHIELAELESSLGANALCPETGERAVGISESAMNLEIQRLLDLDGDGDDIAKGKVDKLIEEYYDYRNCSLTPDPCDRQELIDALTDLENYLLAQEATLMANITQPPQDDEEASDTRLRGDRSRGLFHPNLEGHALQACYVLLAFRGTGQCAS